MATRKETAEGAEQRPQRQSTASRSRGAKPMELAGRAAGQLQQLTGKPVEGITGLQRSDDGWTVQVEVLDLRRVPATTDVLATYEVEIDADGDLLGYQRRHRYVRGSAGQE